MPSGKEPTHSAKFPTCQRKRPKHFLLLVKNIQKLIQKGFKQARFHPKQAAKLGTVIQVVLALTYVKYITKGSCSIFHGKRELLSPECGRGVPERPLHDAVRLKPGLC